MTEQKKLTSPRTYRMGRRRESLEATRQRIAEAAFELHGTVGPAQTSISAVAERAGVQRHTVYSHFPDMTSLIRACTEHGMNVTRIPDVAPWLAVDDPTARLGTALAELYAYYRANARLLGNVIRDLPVVGIGGSEAFLERTGEWFSALADGWAGDDAIQRVRMAAIGHAISYETWRSLTDRGLSDEEAEDLMLRLVTDLDGRKAPVRAGQAARSSIVTSIIGE